MVRDHGKPVLPKPDDEAIRPDFPFQSEEQPIGSTTINRTTHILATLALQILECILPIYPHPSSDPTIPYPGIPC